MKYTINQFRKDYPTEAVCLDKLFKIRYGKLETCPGCGTCNPEFKRITTRRAYQCRQCYYQLYPTAGTVFEKTRTDLTHWFYAMYLMTVTRNGVSAKELERVLGVTYKTAWRMGHCIRVLMSQMDLGKLFGYVEADESWLGSRVARAYKENKEKTPVMAMVERRGRVIAQVVNDVQKNTLMPIIVHYVDKTAKVMTDENPSYRLLHKQGFDHQTVNHSEKEYVKGEISTNTAEGFFSHLKRMIGGSHLWVSKKYLQRYVNECAFRYNHRKIGNGMFEIMLSYVALPLEKRAS